MDFNRRIDRDLISGCAAAAAIFAFAFNGLARYAPPGDVFIAGTVLACGVLTFIADAGDPAQWRRTVIGIVVGLIGAVTLSICGDRAATLAAANDERCAAIQADMLSAHQRMANSADAFQALGCRPQGKDRRIFVPPTDRERAAGKPLPWGGYPPPR